MISNNSRVSTVEEVIEKAKNRSLEDKLKDKKFTNEQLLEVGQFIYNAINAIKKTKEIVSIIIKDSVTGEEENIKIDDLEKYYILSQSQATNGLSKNLTKKITDSNIDILGNAVIENKDFKIFLKGYADLTSNIKTSAVKLLDCFFIEGIKDGTAKLDLHKYMKMRALKDEKTAREQVKEDMKALECVKLEFREKKKGKGKDWIDVNLFGGSKGVKNSIIYFKFNEDFIKHIPKDQYMYLPKQALTFKDKINPHSYHLVRQISLHKRLNAGRINENIITVETLINAVPSLPTYEDVMKNKHKQVDTYIIKPFERDLDAIKEFSWEYVNAYPTNYNEFIKSSIKITWGEEYPDIEKLRNEKKKHRQKTAQNKTIKKKISELDEKINKIQGG